MTDSDRKYMTLALEKCKQGVLHGQSPFGASIIRDSEVLAATHNTVRMTTDCTAHGEIVCIRAACIHTGQIHLAGSTIYSTTEPCPMCFSAIHWARIERIVFAARVEDAKDFGFNELEISNATLKQISGSPIEIVENFMRDESIELFKLWKERNNNPY